MNLSGFWLDIVDYMMDLPTAINQQFANLKMAIEIVDLPIKHGEFPSLCKRWPEGTMDMSYMWDGDVIWVVQECSCERLQEVSLFYWLMEKRGVTLHCTGWWFRPLTCVVFRLQFQRSSEQPFSMPVGLPDVAKIKQVPFFHQFESIIFAIRIWLTICEQTHLKGNTWGSWKRTLMKLRGFEMFHNRNLMDRL